MLCINEWTISTSPGAALVAVYRRTVDMTGPAYINRLAPTGDWAEPPQFAEALAGERNRPLSPDEIRNFEVVQQRLRATLSDDLPPWLREVDQLAQTVLATTEVVQARCQIWDAARRVTHASEMEHPAAAVTQLQQRSLPGDGQTQRDSQRRLRPR